MATDRVEDHISSIPSNLMFKIALSLSSSQISELGKVNHQLHTILQSKVPLLVEKIGDIVSLTVFPRVPDELHPTFNPLRVHWSAAFDPSTLKLNEYQCFKVEIPFSAVPLLIFESALLRVTFDIESVPSEFRIVSHSQDLSILIRDRNYKRREYPGLYKVFPVRFCMPDTHTLKRGTHFRREDLSFSWQGQEEWENLQAPQVSPDCVQHALNRILVKRNRLSSKPKGQRVAVFSEQRTILFDWKIDGRRFRTPGGIWKDCDETFFKTLYEQKVYYLQVASVYVALEHTDLWFKLIEEYGAKAPLPQSH